MLHTSKARVWHSLNSVNHQHYLKRDVGVLIKAWAKKQKLFKALTITHERPKYFDKLPYDIAAGDFVVMAGGAVHYTNGKWFGRDKTEWIRKVPSRSQLGDQVFVDAIDFKETGIEKHGIKHIDKLKYLKFLSFADCPFVDDNCMAQLVGFRESLTHLDVSRCPQITCNGIALLHKLRNLEKVNMNDLDHIKDLILVSMMLEDILPNLRLAIVSEHLKKLQSEIEHAKEHGIVLHKLKEPEELNHGLILDEPEESNKSLTSTKRDINR